MARKNPTDAALKELRAFGLAYPGAHTKSPWPGHLDLAVNDKTFAYLSLEGDPLHISCKLPQTSDDALTLPFTKPTEYGLGRSGWVSASFEENQAIPVDLLKQWIDESYRAQAPKRLSKGLPALSLGEGGATGSVEASEAAPPARATKKKAGARAVKTNVVKRASKKRVAQAGGGKTRATKAGGKTRATKAASKKARG